MTTDGVMPHDAAFWTLMATLALVGVTAIAAGIALYQVYASRSEARIARTLEVCNQYNNSAILDRSLRTLGVAWKDGDIRDDPLSYRLDAITVLNYLDSIAIGIEQGLYVEALVRDHIEGVVRFHYQQYLGNSNEGVTVPGLDPNWFGALESLYKRWTKTSVRFKVRA